MLGLQFGYEARNYSGGEKRIGEKEEKWREGAFRQFLFCNLISVYLHLTAVEVRIKSKVKYTGMAVRNINIATPLRKLTCHMGSQCYLPSGRGDIPAFSPAEAGTRSSDPGGMQG